MLSTLRRTLFALLACASFIVHAATPDEITTAWPVLQDARIDLHIDRRKLLVKLLSELEPLPAQFVYDGDAGFWYGDIESSMVRTEIGLEATIRVAVGCASARLLTARKLYT